MSTANKLTYLNETKSKLKQAINLAGANITNEPFRVYSTKLYQQYLDIIKNGTSALYSAMPKVTGTGTELSLKNTAEAPMVLELSASESTQKTTSGKNLIDLTQLTQALSGAELSNKLANSFTINGVSAWSNVVFFIRNNSKNTVHTISCKEINTIARKSGITVYGTNEVNGELTSINSVLVDIEANASTKITNTYSSGDYEYTAIRFWCNATSNTLDNRVDLNISEIQLEINNTSTNYEEYTNGASPSPSFPQDINVVTGENSVKINNKNLFDKNNDRLVTGLLADDGIFKSNGNEDTLIYNCLPNTTYTISKIKGSRFRVAEFVDTPSIGDTWLNRIINETGTEITFTTTTGNYLAVNYRTRADTLTKDEILNSIQIEKGSTATSYVEHQEQTLSLSLGNFEFASIGEYADKIFNNIPSNPLYDSSLVEGGWYKYKMIGKIVLDGTENWQVETSGRFGILKANLPFLFLAPVSNSSLLGNKCNLYCEKTPDRTWAKTEGFCIDTSNNLRVYDSTFSIDNNVAGYKEWLAEHNLTFYGILETPTKEQITDTTLISQLEAMKNAISYDDETNISQTNANRPFIMSSSAIKNSME